MAGVAYCDQLSPLKTRRKVTSFIFFYLDKFFFNFPLFYLFMFSFACPLHEIVLCWIEIYVSSLSLSFKSSLLSFKTFISLVKSPRLTNHAFKRAAKPNKFYLLISVQQKYVNPRTAAGIISRRKGLQNSYSNGEFLLTFFSTPTLTTNSFISCS